MPASRYGAMDDEHYDGLLVQFSIPAAGEKTLLDFISRLEERGEGWRWEVSRVLGSNLTGFTGAIGVVKFDDERRPQRKQFLEARWLDRGDGTALVQLQLEDSDRLNVFIDLLGNIVELWDGTAADIDHQLAQALGETSSEQGQVDALDVQLESADDQDDGWKGDLLETSEALAIGKPWRAIPDRNWYRFAVWLLHKQPDIKAQGIVEELRLKGWNGGKSYSDHTIRERLRTLRNKYGPDIVPELERGKID